MTFEELYVDSKKPDYPYYPVVWRGPHCKNGSLGYLFETVNHSALIILVGLLSQLESLPRTRAELLDVTDGKFFVTAGVRSRAYGNELDDAEKAFFKSGWFISSSSADHDGIGSVTFNPSVYALDDEDRKVMSILGIHPLAEGSLDPFGW